MENASARFDQIASNYASSEVHAMSPTIHLLHQLLNLDEGCTICDVACGAGHTGLSFAAVASRIVGVDPAPSMLAAFRQLAQDKGIAVEAVEAYAESIPLQDNTFDLVVSRLAPHHFAEVQRAVNEMARVAKPGGAVAIIDLEGDSDPISDEFNHRLEVLHDPTHVRSYTAAKWVSLFKGAGLSVEKVERRLTEKPGGVHLRRWCEIASSGEQAESEIRRLLGEASDKMLSAIGVTSVDDEFMMPVRTVLVIGRKALRVS